MLLLLSMSVVSWTLIVQRTKILAAAKRVSEQFEERFWSGIDLNRLYQECLSRRDDLSGIRITSYNVCYTKLLRSCRAWVARPPSDWCLR